MFPPRPRPPLYESSSSRSWCVHSWLTGVLLVASGCGAPPGGGVPEVARSGTTTAALTAVKGKGGEALSTTNTTYNPSFETDTSCWGTWGASLELSTPAVGTAPHGTRAVTVRRTASSTFGIVESTLSTPSTTANTLYRASAWARAAEGSTSSGKPLVIKLRERDSSGNTVQDIVSPPITLSSRWQRVTVVLRAKGGLALDVRLSHASTEGSADAFQADAISVMVLPADQFPYDAQEGDGSDDAVAAAQYQPIPSEAAVDAKSTTYMQYFIKAQKSAKWNLLAGGSAQPALWTGTASDPWYTGTVNGKSYRFHIPTNATPPCGSNCGSADNPVQVYNPSHTDLGAYVALKLYQARFDHSARTFSGTGAFLRYQNNSAANPEPTAATGALYANSEPFIGNGRGSGLAYDYGLITRADWDSGEIDHAINLNYYVCYEHPTAFRSPATKTDALHSGTGPNDCTGSKPHLANDSDGLPMGARLRLKPSVDCSSRLVPKWKNETADEHARAERFVRMMCRAMQTYGLIIVDSVLANGSDTSTMTQSNINMEHLVSSGFDTAIINGDAALGSSGKGTYSFLVRDEDSASLGTPDGYASQRTSAYGIPWDQFEVMAQSLY